VISLGGLAGRLSHGEEGRELASWVDTENHTGVAVALGNGLTAVEPKWASSVDNEVRGESSGVGDVVGVEEVETAVEATVELGAWLSEAGLCDGVVELEELEADDIVEGSVELVGAVQEVTVDTDLDDVGLD